MKPSPKFKSHRRTVPTAYSVNALSKLTGADRKTIDKAVARAQIKPAGMHRGSPLYRIKDVQSALVSAGNVTAELRAERLRLTTEQADKVALDNAKERKQLVPLADIEAILTESFLPIRQRFLALPSEMCNRCNPTDPQFARAALQEWADEAMRLIRVQLPQPKNEPKASTKPS